MSVEQLVAPVTEVESVRVRLANRVFPTAGRTAKVRPGSIYQLQPDSQAREPQRLLDDAVWPCLSWAKNQARTASDRATVVQSYVASLEELARCRREADDLVRQVCRASIELRQGSGATHAQARREARDKKLAEMVQGARRPWSPPVNALDAYLVSQPVEQIAERLDGALRQATADFARQFFELLSHLVDKKLVGLVEWLPNNCCRYHFFKEIVIQDNAGRSTTSREEYFADERRDRDNGRRIVGQRITEEVEQGLHIHRHARHEHHVMNAFRTSLGNSRVVVPPHVQRLIAALPRWLYPLVEMIDGDIFRERIIEQDYRREAWADVRVKDEPIYGCEPGVIVGPYVLTGWGPREVAAEQERRAALAAKDEREQTTTAARRRLPLLQIAAAACLFLGLVLLLRCFQVGGTPLYSLLATATGLAALWEGMHARAALHGVSPLDARWRTGLFAGLALLPQALAGLWCGGGALAWLVTLALLWCAIQCGYRLWRLRRT